MKGKDEFFKLTNAVTISNRENAELEAKLKGEKAKKSKACSIF